MTGRAKKIDKTLQKSYLEAMDVTMKASALLDKEIGSKIAEEIDKTCYPDNRAIINAAVAGEHKNRFVVDVNMLRL